MKRIVPISVLYTLLIVYALGYLSIEFFGIYGWTLFLLAPFLLGFLPSFIVSNIEPVSNLKSFVLGLSCLFIACIALIILGIEGFVCILMSLPLFIVATILGILLARRITVRKINNPKIILLIILAYIFSFFTLDYVNYTDELIPITSSIVIEQPIEKVWDLSTKDIEISKQDLLLDKFGIAYPKSVAYIGEGVGAIRNFNYSTGSYLQTVTAWDPPNVITFTTEKNPAQMIESNPFWEIHPTHLTGYFVSVTSEIQLTKLSLNQTKAEYTSWYKIHMTPIPYWKLWSNAIIERYHKALLTTLKIQSEM